MVTTETGSGGDWRWAGCSDTPDYGYKFTTSFVDARQREKNFPRHSAALRITMMHLHNNEAGRLVCIVNLLHLNAKYLRVT